MVVIGVLVLLASAVAGYYCCYARRQKDRSTAVVEAVGRAQAYAAAHGGATYEAAVYSNPNYGPGDGMALVRAASSSSSNLYSDRIGNSRGGGSSNGGGSSGDSVLYAVPLESVKLDADGYVYDYTLNAQQQQQQAAYATPADHDDGSVRASSA